MRTMLGRDIRDIVKDDEWQALRASFVGQWTANGNQCVKALKRYVGDMSDPWRVARVYNYLTGTAFRLGTIKNAGAHHLKLRVARAYHQHRRAFK